MRRAISVTGQRNTYIFLIRVVASNPRLATDIANSLSQFYLEDQIENKFEATEFAINWLSDRVLELETDLKDREAEIQQITKDSNLINRDVLEAQSIRAKDLRERLMAAENATELANQRLDDARSLIDTATDTAIADFFQDPVLVNILGRVSSGAPQSLFDDRVTLLQSNLETSATRAETQRAALQVALVQIEGEVAEQNDDLVKLNNLRREAEATRVLYETFLSRLKETSVQIGLQRADSQILSLAKRGRQIAPGRSRIIAQFMVIGALLGTAIIMLRRFRHSGFRLVRDLETATGLPVLGQIPRIPVRRRQSLLNYLKLNPTSAAVESVRNIRTSLLMSDPDNPPRIIMTTSAVPGEGKTTQSLALAQNLSGLGKRVLLIEGDIRRRTFSQYFQNRSQFGLLSVISEEVPFEKAVFTSEDLGADVLLGDRTTVNAADVFSSERFASFMLQLRETYDYVVIDTPPVLAVPDARIIGQLCDAALFSVKWDNTGREQVIEGLRLLLSVGIKPAGLVMTQVDPKRMRKYGYGDRYGAYGKGYYDVK